MKKLFIALSLVSVLIVSACGYKEYGDYTYMDFDHISHWSEVDDLGEDDYELLYVYDRDFKGASCLGCEVVNERLFKFAKEGDHGKDVTFLNTREMTGSRPPHIEDRAPRLYIIKDQKALEVYSSAQEIFEFIDQFEDGDFSWPEPSSE